MAYRWWAVGILLIFLVILALLIAYNWDGEQHEQLPSATLSISPDIFTLSEGHDVTLLLSFDSTNDQPIAADISWEIATSGDTGAIAYPSSTNGSATNATGRLMVLYSAPQDVDRDNQSVTITAAAYWHGTRYLAQAQGFIYPVMTSTKLDLFDSPKSVIAGETVQLQAVLRTRHNDTWFPLTGQHITATLFLPNGTDLEPFPAFSAVTDNKGMATVSVFLSDVERATTAVCWVSMAQNLTGEIDYAGCYRITNITFLPEQPSDFPVVLIHGWAGSATNWLLNYTWFNITQKLQQQGHHVLDFDTITPGIQFLRYDPGWQDHHIPWIAARVNDAIERALVLNGYHADQTVDIVAHSMGGLVSRFLAEHDGADVDYWNDSWMPGDSGYPWYGDGDVDITLSSDQIDDLIVVGTPCHGVPPDINASLLAALEYLHFPWWIGQVQDMIYHSKFLDAMGYQACNLVDYYAVGGDIGFIVGTPMDFNEDNITSMSDGLVPTESPYLDGCPLYVVTGSAWPTGNADHVSMLAVNEDVHEYILSNLC